MTGCDVLSDTEHNAEVKRATQNITSLIQGIDAEYKSVQKFELELETDESDIMALSDLGYKKNKYISSIHIKENGRYEPYLAIELNDDGQMLLLREYLLDDPMTYSSKTSHFGHGRNYYPKSDIDAYLNSEYLGSLDLELQELIPESTLIVSKPNGKKPTSIELIERKVFILSAAEMNSRSKRICIEGEPLEYFMDNIACSVYKTTHDPKDPFMPKEYWTRSSLLKKDCYDKAVIVLGSKPFTNKPVTKESYVRPAFYLDGDIALRKETLTYSTPVSRGDVTGEVFVLDI